MNVNQQRSTFSPNVTFAYPFLVATNANTGAKTCTHWQPYVDIATGELLAEVHPFHTMSLFSVYQIKVEKTPVQLQVADPEQIPLCCSIACWEFKQMTSPFLHPELIVQRAHCTKHVAAVYADWVPVLASLWHRETLEPRKSLPGFFELVKWWSARNFRTHRNDAHLYHWLHSSSVKGNWNLHLQGVRGANKSSVSLSYQYWTHNSCNDNNLECRVWQSQSGLPTLQLEPQGQSSLALSANWQVNFDSCQSNRLFIWQAEDPQV